MLLTAQRQCQCDAVDGAARRDKEWDHVWIQGFGRGVDDALRSVRMMVSSESIVGAGRGEGSSTMLCVVCSL